MSISKRQLRRLIAESISERINEQDDKKEKEYYGFDLVPSHPQALKLKVYVGGPARDLFTRLEKALGADLDDDSYFLWKGYYEKFISKGTPGVFGATGRSLGISRDADPYTYQPLGGNKYRVISGPKASAMGKTFTKKTYKQKEKEKQQKRRGDERLAASGNYEADVKKWLSTSKSLLAKLKDVMFKEAKGQLKITNATGARLSNIDKKINEIGSAVNKISTELDMDFSAFVTPGKHKSGAAYKDIMSKREKLTDLQLALDSLNASQKGPDYGKYKSALVNFLTQVGKIQGMDLYDEMSDPNS